MQGDGADTGARRSYFCSNVPPPARHTRSSCTGAPARCCCSRLCAKPRRCDRAFQPASQQAGQTPTPGHRASLTCMHVILSAVCIQRAHHREVLQQLRAEGGRACVQGCSKDSGEGCADWKKGWPMSERTTVRCFGSCWLAEGGESRGACMRVRPQNRPGRRSFSSCHAQKGHTNTDSNQRLCLDSNQKAAPD